MTIEAGTFPRKHRSAATVGLCRRAGRGILDWLEKRRSRQALAELSEDQLRDIGISRAEARKEVAKSWFWN
ncbi:DUF1127 domain-containing protein [Rhizobium binxianense]